MNIDQLIDQYMRACVDESEHEIRRQNASLEAELLWHRLSETRESIAAFVQHSERIESIYAEIERLP